MFDLNEKPSVRHPSVDRLSGQSWLAPPDREMGVYVPIHSPVNSGKNGSLHLSGVRAHSSGCVIEVVAAVGNGASAYNEMARNVMSTVDSAVRDDGTEDPCFIRLGVRYSDNRTTTNIINYRRLFALEGAVPAVPTVLVSLPRVLSNGPVEKVIARLDFWLWPSPPPERFELLTEWPGADLPGAGFALDGELIAQAAARSYLL